MKQAKYSPHNIGHFGLASDSYCHFTSPIRRFSDLVVHEVLRSVCFNKEKSNISPQSLEPVGDHLSSRERETMEAEREYSKLKKCRFMERYLSRRMRGTIVSITGFGIFVELDDYPVEGLIRLGDLRDDYYRYFEESQQLIGQRRHRKYRLGQKLTVFVSEVDIFRRRIRFIPSGEGYR